MKPSDLVSQRTQELGVGLVLGASAGRVTRLGLSQEPRLAGIGLGVGLPDAVAVSHEGVSQRY